MAKEASIFSDFLSALGVPHTRGYSDSQFKGMTFKSLFGLSHLLSDYGIPNEGWQLNDKNELKKVTPPYLAQLNDGVFVIVREYDPDTDKVVYTYRGTSSQEPINEFNDNFNGVILAAYPDAKSAEPHFASHAVSDIVSRISKYVLLVVALGVMAYFFVTRGVYRNVATILITLLDIFGLWLSYMLVQKSLGIHTSTSERVCGVLEKGGCDVITTSKASKLFGVFSWSEVGFAYFGVSLTALLIFPHIWPALALCNICCLPYTVWSISYQKFVARHWCTLCVGVQSTLWALFFCYLGGGLVSRIFPLQLDYFVLAGVYIVTVLALNYLLSIFKNIPYNEKNTEA